MIQENGAKPVTIEILRAGNTHTVELTPVYNTTDEEEPFWSIGVYFADYERVETQLGFFEAFDRSIDQNRKSAKLIFGVLGGLIQQRMSPKSLEGPIGIARLSGEAARNGFADLIELMALISLNLGIFNLLPIPILDGGVIALLLIEMVRQKDLSITVKERIIQVGLVFIMLLFAFVMYNDILKSLPRS
jgi:regulator of sigma E protease